jgi:hypothetical protein
MVATREPPEPLNANDKGYIPKIYVPSDFAPPRIDGDNTELAMMIMFEEIEHTACCTAKVRRNTNLSPLQHQLL